MVVEQGKTNGYCWQYKSLLLYRVCLPIWTHPSNGYFHSSSDLYRFIGPPPLDLLFCLLTNFAFQWHYTIFPHSNFHILYPYFLAWITYFLSCALDLFKQMCPFFPSIVFGTLLLALQFFPFSFCLPTALTPYIQP